MQLNHELKWVWSEQRNWGIVTTINNKVGVVRTKELWEPGFVNCDLKWVWQRNWENCTCNSIMNNVLNLVVTIQTSNFKC